MANTRITQGVIKPNEDYDVRHINATGVITATNLNLSGVLTYEDVTNVDSIGIITARKGVVSLGVVTATAFHGDGSNLTGVDSTALKDTAGAVKIQALTTGAVHTGISTFDNIKVGSGVTIESNGQATFTGIVTFGSNSTTIGDNVINVGTALTLGHTQGLQFHTQNLHADGFEINNINASGIITAAQFSGDGSNLANLPAGLGTALSSTQSSPLNKIYYTNTVLPVESTVTVDTPASASAAYTQYADISVGTGADLIISDGDDLIPDVLGLRPDGTFGGGALGRMRVDKIVGKDANSAVNFEKGIVVTGVVTATSFSGDGSALTGITQTTINNNADNRVITGSGTANTLNGESGLVYNGYNLAISGTGQQQLNLGSTNAGGVAIILDGDSNGDAAGGDYSIIRHNTDGDLEFFARNPAGATNTIFRQGTSEKVRIDAGGNMNVTGVVTATAFHGDGSALTGTGVGGSTNINTTGIITATAFVPTTGQLSDRNILMNGSCAVSQRGTSFSGSGFTLDRYYVGSGDYSVAQVTDAPSNTGLTYSLRVSRTASTTGYLTAQMIELPATGQAGQFYNGAKLTLSGYVKGTSGATIVPTLRFSTGINGSNGSTFTRTEGVFTCNGSWQPFTFHFTVDENVGGSDKCVQFYFTFVTTATGQNVFLTGLQLEAGEVDTPFEHRTYSDELRKCKRYYQKDLNRRAYWGSGNVSDRQFPVRFGVEMRDTPTISFYSTSLDGGSAAAYNKTRQGYNFAMTGNGRFYEWAHTASAEL
tara:strand:+ start:274 stop:2574 length:2301 start_codon:yes stop_codon:yes gene_type:complete